MATRRTAAESQYQRHENWAKTIGRGAWHGAIATLPMTAVMVVGNQLATPGSLPRLRSLPPTRAGKRLANLFGVRRSFMRTGLGLLTHLGIGALAGSVYAVGHRVVNHAVGSPRKAPAGRYAAAVLFGTAVWASGYLGVLPSLQLLEQPHRAPRGQTLTMLAAHWVFGSALEALEGEPRT